MIRKILHALLVLIMIVPLMPITSAVISDGYIHTAHYYAVSLDGEGDAIVRARIELNNTTNEAINEIELEIPGRIIVYKAVEEYPGFEAIDYTKDFTSSSTILKLNLPERIWPSQAATIVLFYKAPGYAENSFGVWDFDFKTIIDKDAVLIEHIRVAVNAQEGFNLSGGEAEIDYQKDYFSLGAMEAVANKDAMEPGYRRASDGIRNARGLVKTASNLDPWETFSVKGRYSDNWIALHMMDIFLALTGMGLLFVASRAMFSNKINFALLKKLKFRDSIARIAGFGFLAAGLLLALWIGIIITITVMDSGFGYGIGMLIMPLILLLGLALSIAIAFGVPLYTGIKHGPWEGFLTGISEMAWLMALLLLVLIIAGFLFPPIIYY